MRMSQFNNEKFVTFNMKIKKPRKIIDLSFTYKL